VIEFVHECHPARSPYRASLHDLGARLSVEDRDALEPVFHVLREFAEVCAQHGVTRSMGATGICWDNAAAESFFAILKRELVHRHAWATRAHAKQAIVRWIEGWYNPRRPHSSIDYLRPNEKENAWHSAERRAA
jgi:transposase InsO family protein